MSEASNGPRKPKLPHADADFYVLDGERRPMPRTTTVIDRGIGKPFLTTWAAKLERQKVLEEVAAVLGKHLDEVRTKAVLRDVKKRLGRDLACDVQKQVAADFGTATHALLEDHLREKAALPGLDRTDEPEPEPLVTRAAGLAKDWLEAIAFEPDPEGIEERLWSEDERIWSAGTADAFGTADLDRLLARSTWNRKYEVKERPGSRVPLLVDWKTSKSIGVSHKVQAGAYLTYMIDRGRIQAPCYACILRVAKTEDDPMPLEAVLIHPAEFARYGGAFRYIRRIFNFLSQEEDLERAQWRARRRTASAGS
ncbi:MAG: hypothetical protein P8R42_21260 [Candidatus Binatia bacterium]|nr:hypothetical protein [Candidatus Binatia bacterium]